MDMYGYVDIANWRKDETIAKLVKATFPDYRRPKLQIKAVESVTLQDLNWSGGTRSTYKAVTIDGQPLGTSEAYSREFWSAKEGATVPIPVGAVVVRAGTFCGKPSLMTIYVNPADMPKYLPVE
jgi:hypothetical protein